MQFSIDINALDCFHSSSADCLSMHLPFHCNIGQLVCHLNFLIRKEIATFWKIIVLQITESLICLKLAITPNPLGLKYHAIAPFVSLLKNLSLVEQKFKNMQ